MLMFNSLFFQFCHSLWHIKTQSSVLYFLSLITYSVISSSLKPINPNFLCLMESKFLQEKAEGSSTLFPDHNLSMEGEFSLKKEEGDAKNSLMEAVQLEIELEKRKIREEMIASEIIQKRKELETEIRMELMMEKQMMGMRNLYKDSSVIDPCMLMTSSKNLGFQGGSYFHKNLLNVGISEDEFREKLKYVSHHHAIDRANDSLQINADLNKNNVFGDGEKQQSNNDAVLGKWPFERDPNLITAHIAGKSMAELGGVEVLDQTMPNLGISGVKRKAEASAASLSDEKVASIACKNLQKKWYCSLCDVAATSAGGFNLHLHGKKHKAKEAMSKSGDIASSISTDGFCAENLMQTTEQLETLVQPSEEEKSQVQSLEEERSQMQPIDDEKSRVQPMEEQKSQVQSMENEKSQVQPMEDEKSGVQPIEDENSRVQAMEDEKSQSTKKWECSICQISATSEILLRSHLQGKKHKAKEAKLGICHGMSDNCAETTKAKAVTVHKWYCSLCQVSAASEKNLNDHFQGKKHKAKVGLLHQEADNVDSKTSENMSEDLKMVQEKECLNSEQEPRKSQVSKQKISNRLNIVKTEIEGDISHDEGKKLDLVKFWHCKVCNEGTYDDATMALHRKSSKHMDMLRKIGGGLIVVSNTLKEAVEGGKVSEQCNTLNENEN
ncbi:P-selectin glycoprotein ligand 1 [Bienertia sinuspersici]